MLGLLTLAIMFWLMHEGDCSIIDDWLLQMVVFST